MIPLVLRPIKAFKAFIGGEKILREKSLRDFVETMVNSTIITFDKKVLDVTIYCDRDANRFFSIGESGVYFSPYEFLDEFNRFIKELASSKAWSWTTINYYFYKNRTMFLLVLNNNYCWDFTIRIKEV